jgi:hypothetical protein
VRAAVAALGRADAPQALAPHLRERGAAGAHECRALQAGAAARQHVQLAREARQVEAGRADQLARREHVERGREVVAARLALDRAVTERRRVQHEERRARLELRDAFGQHRLLDHARARHRQVVEAQALAGEAALQDAEVDGVVRAAVAEHHDVLAPGRQAAQQRLDAARVVHAPRQLARQPAPQGRPRDQRPVDRDERQERQADEQCDAPGARE